ncbi:MAG: NAD(P)H-hydrate dehydratase [Christensenellales bacterium]|jgi:hydroxyethylthiazole kinase-like uncharacterized protein yjeF
MAVYVVYPDEMKKWESGLIESGVNSLVLMENAAKNMAEVIVRRHTPCDVLFFCSTGNNGGDGIAVARHLLTKGFAPKVLLLGKEASLTKDARINLEMAARVGVATEFCQHEEDLPAHINQPIIVDALFGTGIGRPIEGLYARAVERINQSGAVVFSVDIPSGIDAYGQVCGCAVYADTTVVFQFHKTSLLLEPGRSHAGEIVLCDIGVPAVETQSFAFEMLEHEDVARYLPPRERNTHKGDYGKIAVIAGSSEMAGAAFLCAKAALRTGCGLLSMGASDMGMWTYHVLLPEATCRYLPHDEYGRLDQGCAAFIEKMLSGKDAVVFGPGIGRGAGVTEGLRQVLKSGLPCVLDADGLNTLADDEASQQLLHSRVVITPHPGEMARLCGRSVEEILQNPIQTVQAFAARHGVNVLLKGRTSMIAHHDGIRLTFNTTGTPAMAKGGSGDVLSGIIAALLARGLHAYDAARLGSYILGRCGEISASALGENSILASDMIDKIGKVINI